MAPASIPSLDEINSTMEILSKWYWSAPVSVWATAYALLFWRIQSEHGFKTCNQPMIIMIIIVIIMIMIIIIDKGPSPGALSQNALSQSILL